MDTENTTPKWPLIVGVCFLAVTLFFFMALVLVAVILRMEVPFDTRFLVVVIISLTSAAGSAFLGGYAKASGKISLPLFESPVTFGFTGGIAVFFITMLFGHLLYSGKQETGTAAITAFNNFVESYREKYEDLHDKLDLLIIVPEIDKIRTMSKQDYDNFIVNEVGNTPNAHSDISAIADFYENILKCEQANGIGCIKSDINRVFGDEMRNFWYSYRPYILVMRNDGYPKIAELVQQYAEQENG